MKKSLVASALAVALFVGSTASAATVPFSDVENLEGVENLTKGESKIELYGVEDVRLSFSSPTNSAFRGEVTWSTSSDRSSTTFTENVLDDGAWLVSNNSRRNRGGGIMSGAALVGPLNNSTDNEIFIDFDGRGDTVFLWLNTNSGEGMVNYTATRALVEAAPLTPVPLPAGAWLLITALGAIGLVRRRKTA